MAVHAGGDKECQGVRPQKGLVLGPPPFDDNGHIETQHKGHRNVVTEVVAVEGHFLKDPAER